MSFTGGSSCTALFLFLLLSFASGGTNFVPTSAGAAVNQKVASQINFITAEELKAKLSKNVPVIIIDVRSADA